MKQAERNNMRQRQYPCRNIEMDSPPGFNGPLPRSATEMRDCLQNIADNPQYDLRGKLMDLRKRGEEWLEIDCPATDAELYKAAIDAAAHFHWERTAGPHAVFMKELKRRNDEYSSLVRAGKSDLVPEEWGGENYGLGPEPAAPLSFPSVNVTGVDFYDCEVSIFAKDLLDGFDGELKKRRSWHKQKQRTESFHQQIEERKAQSEEASAFATGYGTSSEFPEELKELLGIEECDDEEASTDADGDEVLVTPLPKSSKPRNRWPGSSDENKTRAMVRDIHEQGRGIAITCHLSGEVVEAARSSKKGLPSHLLERLTKLLKKRFKQPVDIVIVLEQGLGEAPHIHGVVDVADTKENRRLVGEALTVLGACPQIGPMKRQVHVADLYEPDGWGRYPFKRHATSKSNLKVDRTMAASQNLRKRGEANYNSFKAKQSKTQG